MPSYHVQDRDQRPSGDESASSMDENGYNVNDDLVSDQDLPDTTSYDPFVPVERVPAKPIVNIVTLRAIVLGSLCGSLVNASNIYLGLKVGWTSSANILGAIVGFSVLKKWAARSQNKFGVHENNIVQTVATASGGMSHAFISAIPALYQLGLLQTPVRDFLRIVLFTAVGGYFGLLSIVPRENSHFMTLTAPFAHVARDLNLVFPSSTATAMTIRSMHSAADGGDSAGCELKVTMYAFVGAMILRIVSQYALGLLWDWHVFTWLAGFNIAPGLFVAIESWGWFIEWSPAMMGSGMLVDFGVACSFFAGSVAAWGIIGPVLVARGIAFGQSVSVENPAWSEFMSYKSMSLDFANATHPSPRYWLLWPGVACTLAVALVELACQWRGFWKLGLASAKAAISTVRQFTTDQSPSGEYEPVMDSENEKSEVEEESRIAVWMWAPGVAALAVTAALFTCWQFSMSPVEAILALVFSFCMSLVAIQATGATDTTPLNAISMMSQMALSGVTASAGKSVVEAQRLNLLGASLTTIGASQGVDLMGDFRVGFLLRTPARLQYAAQLIGTLVATLVAPSVFVLFTTAYPCIISGTENDKSLTGETQKSCEFAVPSVMAWKAVAVAATEPTPPIPLSSVYFATGLATAASLLIVAKRVFLIGRRKHWQQYVPNMMIFGLAFTLPSPQNGLSMLLGAIVAKLWQSKNPGAHSRFGFAVAAGLVAGEGIGGAVNCVLSILGIGGQQWSISMGCPAGEC